MKNKERKSTFYELLNLQKEKNASDFSDFCKNITTPKKELYISNPMMMHTIFNTNRRLAKLDKNNLSCSAALVCVI